MIVLKMMTTTNLMMPEMKIMRKKLSIRSQIMTVQLKVFNSLVKRMTAKMIGRRRSRKRLHKISTNVYPVRLHYEN